MAFFIDYFSYAATDEMRTMVVDHRLYSNVQSMMIDDDDG
jgi:5-formaminoimidazole-4-carboxamide-1-beta-D-ribofuranosyl 5'-monophosphate synthetase